MSSAKGVAATAALLMTMVSPAIEAQAYRITVKRVEGNVYQAIKSKVLIETRVCADLDVADEGEEAILNWEGRYGYNWLLFTTSRIKCDVLAIR